MSDEQSDEQATPPAPMWGDSINAERQAELQTLLDAWKASDAGHGDRRGPFDGVSLSGSDAFWLAEQSERDADRRQLDDVTLLVKGDIVSDLLSAANQEVPYLHLAGADLSEAHLEGADFGDAHLEGTLLIRANLEGAFLGGAYLEGADLSEAHLEGADLSEAHLERAFVSGTRLKGANLREAHLEGAFFRMAHLEGTFLREAHLEGADLSEAHLAGADLSEAHLEGADLSGAQLDGANLGAAILNGALLIRANMEGTDLTEAHLAGANLREASFDKATRLNAAVLTNATFDQVSFDNTNLTVIDWSLVTTLGDEHTAHAPKHFLSRAKARIEHLEECKAAVRANRMLSVNLHAQGLAEDGDRFAYRAQVLQRQVFRYQGKLGAYLFSWLLWGLAGYGYRLGRIFIVYGAAVLLFAAGYFLAGGVTPQAHLSLQQQALDALQVSLNAIHGRVFFTQLGLDTLQSWLATLESIVGIVIEGVFVAMLIQRFFAR